MRANIIGVCMACAASALSCIDDEDRCSDGQTLDSFWGACVEETPPEPAADAGDTPDGGDTGGEAVLGEACEADEDCAVYNADYCLILPSDTKGFCSLKDCSNDPDDCPSGYACCIAPDDAFYPTHCMAEEVFTDSGAMLCVL